MASNKELIIQQSSTGVDIAIFEDKKLVELHNEKMDASFSVGDLYLGKVKKLIPSLNAAFVDIGYGKDAFLHYTDLSPYIRSIIKFTQQSINNNQAEIDFSSFIVEPEIVKTGKINEILVGKPNLLVQISKEPIASKGPRLSCELSLPGRFIVLTPFNDIVAISKKIHSADERKRLQKIIESIKPKNLGVIVRTAAEGQKTAELHEDLMSLVDRWKIIQQNLKNAVPPTKILGEQTKTTSILRDLLTPDFQRIIVNDKSIYEEIRLYIQRIAPTRVDIVTLHQHDISIFDQYNVTKQIKSSFGKTINMPSGAYLIIEHTEALHVVDVNSGYKSGNKNQEENSLETNIEAAHEIARQLRLRDMGGIIIVDFIDMKSPENKKKVVKIMEDLMKTDRSKHAILPLSKFGIMQITRQRMRPEININTLEVCPSCQGSGKISATLVLEDEIAKNIYYLTSHKHKYLMLVVHPIIYAYLTKSIFSILWKWRWRFKQMIKIKVDTNYHLTEFRFFDKLGEEIKL